MAPRSASRRWRIISEWLAGGCRPAAAQKREAGGRGAGAEETPIDIAELVNVLRSSLTWSIGMPTALPPKKPANIRQALRRWSARMPWPYRRKEFGPLALKDVRVWMINGEGWLRTYEQTGGADQAMFDGRGVSEETACRRPCAGVQAVKAAALDSSMRGKRMRCVRSPGLRGGGGAGS